jgi:hypothetical protein
MLQTALKSRKSSPNKSRKRVPGTELPDIDAKLTETTHIHSQLFLHKGVKKDTTKLQLVGIFKQRKHIPISDERN